MRWNNDELNFLIENSNKMNIAEIAKCLNRTNIAVYKKCLKLGIKYINSESVCTKWTDNEINFLKQNYMTLTNSFLAKKLNKNSKQICTKIKDLNLNGTRINQDHLYFDPDEIDFINNNWTKMNDKDLADNINKLYNPCRKRTEKTIANYRKLVLKINRPINSELNNIGNFTWTNNEETFLINNFYNLSILELSNCLGKTESAILNKSKKLGLKSLNSKGIKWTQERIEFLKDNFNTLSINTIAKKLQLPVEKILAKAIELNIVYQVKQLTNPEIFVKNQLEKLNINFEYQKDIYYNKTNRYRVDYIINNIIIEVQGDYYHCNPKIYKDGPVDIIQANNIEKDITKKEKLSKMGYKVYYIWENDINTNPNEVINFLAALFSNK